MDAGAGCISVSALQIASKVAATTTIDDEFASFVWSNKCFSLEQITPLTFRCR
jgi:hypothetical protein